jgi:hypothetical protein
MSFPVYLAQTANEWLATVITLLVTPYILSLAALVLVINRKRRASIWLLVPAILSSLFLLTGDIAILSVTPSVICIVTVALFFALKPSRPDEENA